MKRKLISVIVYSAMLLTACMLSRQAAGRHDGTTREAASEEVTVMPPEAASPEVTVMPPEAASPEEVTVMPRETASPEVTMGLQEIVSLPEATAKPQETVDSGGTGSGEYKELSGLEEAVAQAVLDYNADRFALGECEAEGHYIMDTEEEDDRVKSYVLTMYGMYGFEDGNFVKVSGSGVIPAVITHTKTPDGGYELLDYQIAMDGGMYLGSVKELFPKQLQELCITPPEELKGELEKQERQYAAAYLGSIGRAAWIGEYRDFEHPLLTDMGVSVEVSNRMSEYRELADYPYWIGNLERVEAGTRYLYEMDYASESREIVYTKYDCGTGKIVEQRIFDSLTGLKKAGQTN